MKFLVFTTSFLAFAFSAMAGTACPTQQVLDKIQYCRNAKEIQKPCTDSLSPEDEAYTKQQMALAFENSIEPLQKWLCEIHGIKFIKSGYEGLSLLTLNKTENIQILGINSRIVTERLELDFAGYRSLGHWFDFGIFGSPNAVFNLGFRIKEALTKDSSFAFRSTAQTWPFLLRQMGHEFGHYLANVAPYNQELGFPCNESSCANYKNSFASVSFQDPYNGGLIEVGKLPKLVDSSELSVQKRWPDDISYIQQMAEQYRSLLASSFASPFATQDEEEDLCETVMLYVLEKAGVDFTVQFNSSESVDLFERFKNPQGKMKQKIDFIERALKL